MPIPVTGKKIEDHLTGWQRIHVTNFEHPYMKNWWVPGCTIGYEHTFINALADFLASLEGGPPFQPDMRTALRTQTRLRRGAPERPPRAMGGNPFIVGAIATKYAAHAVCGEIVTRRVTGTLTAQPCANRNPASRAKASAS